MMKTEYSIVNHEDSFKVYINSCKSPIEILENLKESFVQQNILYANIIIDGLLYYGNNNQRYLKLNLEKGEFIDATFLEVPKNSNIRKESMYYFNENRDLLKYSILDSIDSNLIEKGVAI